MRRSRQRCGSRQPGLGLRVMPEEKHLREAFAGMGLKRPFEEAIKSPAIAICLRNVAYSRLNRSTGRT